MFRIKRVQNVRCRFQTDSLFNQEFLDLMTKLLDLKEIQLWEDDKLVASIPYETYAKNQYIFYCGAMPYFKAEWFCEDTKYLAKLNQMLLNERTPIEVINLISEKKENFSEDYGLAIIKTVPKEEVPNLYEEKFRKNIKRTIRLTKDLEYRPLNSLDQAKKLLEYWFEIHENPNLVEFERLFELWYKNGDLYLNGTFKDNNLIGADYIYIGELEGEKIACGILTPWYKTEENKKLEVGKFSIISALDFLYKKGFKKFSLGDRGYTYKINWETEAYQTYCLGTGASKTKSFKKSKPELRTRGIPIMR